MYPKRRVDLLAQDLGDEYLLYDVDNQAVHVLNPTAGLIWTLCDGTHDVSAVAAALQETFAIPDQTGPDQAIDLQQDVTEILAEFAEKGLMEA